MAEIYVPTKEQDRGPEKELNEMDVRAQSDDHEDTRWPGEKHTWAQ